MRCCHNPNDTLSLSTNIGAEFYQRTDLSRDLLHSSLSHLPGLPDFRLRAINKMFLKSFISCCPPAQHTSVLLPTLAQLLPFMLGHLTERWAHVKRVRESPGFDEDNTDSAEVLEDVVLRVMAREYLDTVRAALCSGGVVGGGGEEGSQGGEQEVGRGLSGLGETVLAAPALSQVLASLCPSYI